MRCEKDVVVKIVKSAKAPSYYEGRLSTTNAELREMIESCGYVRCAHDEYTVAERDALALMHMFEENGFGYELIDERKRYREYKEHEWVTKPLNHQLNHFEYSRKHRVFVLADEMGLGKTMQALNIAVDKKENCGCKHCLVVCCMGSTVLNWEHEVSKHTKSDCIVIGKAKSKGSINAAKLAELKRIPKEYFWILNVEALRSVEIAKLLAKYTRDDIIGIVIIDELHLCKTPNSSQAKGILGLQPEFKVALSGTPVVKNPLTMYLPLKWLEQISETYTNYCNYYVEYAPFGARIPRGFKHTWELRKMLESCMIRSRKADVLDLAQKTRELVYLEMTPQQREAYAEAVSKSDMSKYKIALQLEHVNMLQSYLKLRQVASDVHLYDEDKPSSSSKIDWAVEKVAELVGDGESVVVFSCWRYMVAEFANRLSKLKIKHACITGDTKLSDRDKAVSSLGDKVKCIIGTVQAAGVGLNMVAASTVIFLDLPWDRATLEQAEDRVHRIGSKGAVTSYVLLSDSTIDEDMWHLLDVKGRFADSMLSEY